MLILSIDVSILSELVSRRSLSSANLSVGLLRGAECGQSLVMVGAGLRSESGLQSRMHVEDRVASLALQNAFLWSTLACPTVRDYGP